MKLKLFSILKAYDTPIWVRFIGTVLTSLTGFMLRPFLVFYLYDQLQGQVLLSMMIVGLQPLCGIVVSLFGGRLSDKYGRKPIMVTAQVIQLLSMIGYIFASGVWEYAILSILNGIGFALFMPAANAQVSDVVPEEKRAEVFALLHTALNLGAAFGPVVGLAMFKMNPKFVFMACAISIALYALLVLWKVPETLPKLLDGVKSKVKTELPKMKIRWADHKYLILFTLFSMPITLLYAQTESNLPLHLENIFDDGKTVFATLVTFNGLLVILGQMYIAKRTENLRPARVIGVSYLLFALVALGYGYVNLFVLLLVVEAIFTIGEMLSGPHMQKMVSVMAPEEHRGFYFSVYSMGWQFSRGIGPMLGGLLFQNVSGSFMFLVMGVILLVGGMAQQIVIRSLEKPSREQEVSTLSA